MQKKNLFYYINKLDYKNLKCIVGQIPIGGH